MALNKVQTEIIINFVFIHLYEQFTNSGNQKLRNAHSKHINILCKTRLSRFCRALAMKNLYFHFLTIITVGCAQKKHILTVEMHKTTGFPFQICSAHRIYHQELLDSWNRNAFNLQCQHVPIYHTEKCVLYRCSHQTIASQPVVPATHRKLLFHAYQVSGSRTHLCRKQKRQSVTDVITNKTAEV